MAGSRPLSTGMLATASSGSNSPLFFIEIDWTPSFASYLCSYGALTWNGQAWVGANVAISDFGPDGKPARIILGDTDAAFRTLLLGNGLRDKRIRIWKAYREALSSADPILLFDGYADGSDWADGKLSFNLDWTSSDVTTTPRERIGPGIGVNFVAAPNTKISWAGQILVLEGRN